MTDDTMKPYLISYRDGGAQWGFELYAKDEDDAMRRLKLAATFGKVDGELMFRVAAATGAAAWLPIVVRLRNWWKGRAHD